MEGYTAKDLCARFEVAEITMRGWLKKAGAIDYVVAERMNKRTYSPDILPALEKISAKSPQRNAEKAPKMQIVRPEDNYLHVLPPPGRKPEKLEYAQVVLICDAFADSIDIQSACRAAGISVHGFLAAVMANNRYKELWYAACFKWRAIHAANLEMGLYAVLGKILNTTQKSRTVRRYKPTAVGIDDKGEVIYARELIEEITTIEDWLPTPGDLSLVKKMIDDMAHITATLEEQEKAALPEMDDAALDAAIKRLEG